MKVILFCPVRERPGIFAEVLESHRALKGISERWYFDDNDSEETRALLRSEMHEKAKVRLLNLTIAGTKSEYARPDAATHQWTAGLMSRVTEIKNLAIQRCLDSRADYLFLCDADVVLHPDLVQQLMEGKPSIISAIYWSQWRPNEPYMPNVWDSHPYGFASPDRIVDMAAGRALNGVFRVNGLGACTLIHRSVLEAGVSFAPVPGLPWPGEDRHFCVRATAAGFPLLASAVLPPFHIYRESQLEEARAWRREGYRPDYFREVWLTDEWKEQVRNIGSTVNQAQKTIAVCLPGETFSTTWVCNWSQLLPQLMQRFSSAACLFVSASSPHVVRASAMESVMALPEKPDYVLWIDDDQILSPAKFDLLLNDLEQLPEADMVAAWSWCQDYNEATARVSAGRYSAEDSTVNPIPASEMERLNGLIEVEWTGFPAVLMRYSALEKAGAQPFAPIPAPNSRWGWTGEDLSFCIHLRTRAKGRVFVDTRCFVPHLKLRSIGPQMVKAEEQGVLVEASTQAL